MIEAISVANEATFDSPPQLMDGLSQFNYIYGANGTGKTTLSRIIAKSAVSAGCSLKWKNGTELETVVYNRDFVSTNFHQCDELPGIFTLGEKNAEIIKKIAEAQQTRDELIQKLETLKTTLQGADGNGGKKAELGIIEDTLRDACWSQKQKHDAIFKGAFEGFRNNQDKFKEKVLQESKSNTESLCDLADLESRAARIFSQKPTLANPIQPIDFGRLLDFENSPILTKHVVGKSDIDIAALILKLGNSDWVKTGRAFYSSEEAICPFCQQKTTPSLENSLKEYFDEAFERDTAAIANLEGDYTTESARVQQRLDQVISGVSPFLDVERLQEAKNLFDASIRLNAQHLARKKKEPSQSIQLESLANACEAITATICDANTKVTANNSTVNNLATETKTLVAQVWRYLLNVELKENLESYGARKASADAAITSLEAKIKEQEELIAAKSVEIADLEKETTSIQPTIDGINRLLKSFGFRGFELRQADNKRCYKLIRPDGADAKETLSEGERTFVSFLYFYHLLKGSTSESGTANNRVVVFDDPVSSLDSDILFIVSSLIKGLFEEVRSERSQIKQIFVMTHNVYFHKEVTFNARRHHEAMNEETFWVIRKFAHNSTLQKHLTNPVKTSYELLWAEVRLAPRSNLTIQNTLRRILENYFKILGGVDFDAICNLFGGKDRLICNSLFSWINDGSHSAHDDLYLSIEDSAVDAYLRVFRQIFDRTGHLPHYKMMMGDAFSEVTDDAVTETAAVAGA